MASSADNAPASIPPRPGASPETEIAPQLEDVLRNLNVNLEDELVRYRRQSHGRVPPPPPPRRAPQRQSLDLISVSASSSPSAPPSKTVPGGQPPTPPPPPPNPFLNQAAEPLEAESLEAAPIAPVEPGLAEAGEAAATDLSVPSSETVPEGYLESSEELLKSIADQSTEPGPEPYSPERKSYGLLKLAGLVLVVLGGIGVGVAITYPSQFQGLRSRLWPTTPDDTTDENAASPETPDSSSETAVADPDTSDFDPPGPDLSTREFVELDLESLSTLEIEGNNGSGAALPAPGQTAPGQLPPPTATPTPSGQPAQPAVGANNNGTTETPDAAGATAGAAEVSPGTTAAVTGSNFYVVTSYTGDASLNQARELVPDAFVRNFQAGARIQLAAFDNRAQAEDQVAFLTQQGAAVELFGPTNE